MELYTGKKFVLRRIRSKNPHEPELYAVVEELFLGADPNKPQMTGEFILVEVSRHFRVVQTRDFEVQELD